LAQQLPTAVDRASPDRKPAHTAWALKKSFRPTGRDSSGTGKIAPMALKNLQNPRICHVPMWLANAAGAVLYDRGVLNLAVAAGP